MIKKYKFKEGDQVFIVLVTSGDPISKRKYSSENNHLDLVTPQSVDEADKPKIGEEMIVLGESNGIVFVKRKIPYDNFKSFNSSMLLLLAPDDHPLVEFYRVVFGKHLDISNAELEDEWVSALMELELTILDMLVKPFLVNADD